MLGESQETFIGRVTSALGDRGRAVPLPDDLEIARVISPEEDLLAVFAARIDESGMHAHRVADEQELVAKVVELADAFGAVTALVPDEPIPARARIIDALRRRQVRLLDANDADAAFTADVGITGVALAIAETASVCVTSGGPHRRLASLAVPHHIAIVRADQVLPDLLDWAVHPAADLPACEVLISGPSKTADIEMILVTGVHGPKEVHVIIVGSA